MCLPASSMSKMLCHMLGFRHTWFPSSRAQ
jgi:hypothetical protein